MVLALGIAAAVLMVVAEVTTLYDVDVSAASCSDLADPEKADTCHTLASENHAFALVPVALLTAVMAVGAGLGGSRPAGFALIGAGIVALVIALAVDLPKTDETGELSESFAAAHAVMGPAFWFELAGGLLAVLAGALRLWRPVSRAT